VPGFIGFAVGRTSFWDSLVALRDGKITRKKAVEDIAGRFIKWTQVFVDAKKAA
jgi:myo-inositol catabolism protein IolC